MRRDTIPVKWQARAHPPSPPQERFRKGAPEPRAFRLRRRFPESPAAFREASDSACHRWHTDCPGLPPHLPVRNPVRDTWSPHRFPRRPLLPRNPCRIQRSDRWPSSDRDDSPRIPKLSRPLRDTPEFPRWSCNTGKPFPHNFQQAPCGCWRSVRSRPRSLISTCQEEEDFLHFWEEPHISLLPAGWAPAWVWNPPRYKGYYRKESFPPRQTYPASSGWQKDAPGPRPLSPARAIRSPPLLLHR